MQSRQVTGWLILSSLLASPLAAAEPAGKQPEVAPATAEQLADLRVAVEKPGTYADTKLQHAMVLPENEGLAMEMAREARRLYEAGDRSNSFYNLMHFLSVRAMRPKQVERGRAWELHIDGPYLPLYAEILLEEIRDSLAAETGWGPGADYTPLHLHLAAHADSPLREPALALARRYSRVVSTHRGADDNAAHHRAASQFRYSLATLQLLGEIRDGMTLAELEEILGGEPSRSRENERYWFLAVPFRKMHFLRAEVDADGKVGQIRIN